MSIVSKQSSVSDARQRLLRAAMRIIRTKGFSAMSVDDVCGDAKVTKGAFFHHFASKQAFGVAAAEHFASMADGVFGSADYRKRNDPVDRLLGYVDLRMRMLRGPVCEFTCVLGTLVQETYDTHPDIREACDRHLKEHLQMLMVDIRLARKQCGRDAVWSAESLALHMQAVLQGAFIFSKARQSPEPALEILGHLKRYLKLLFKR